MRQGRLIAVAGNIGVGKSTLASGLAQALGAGLILEEYDENPFLPAMLGGQAQAALPCELDFLLGRARQLCPTNLTKHALYVADYVFEKNRLFAQRNLGSQEWAVFERIERQVAGLIERPGVVVYLEDTPERCLERIRRRGRPYEQKITARYLAWLAQGYDGLFAQWDQCPVVRVNAEAQDVRQAAVVDRIARQTKAMLVAKTQETAGTRRPEDHGGGYTEGDGGPKGGISALWKAGGGR